MRFILLLLFVIQTMMRGECQNLPTGTGSFIFSRYSPFIGKPIRVFYHIPVGQTDSLPVLMALHGDERDAQAYVNDWISAADQNGFMVFAPEFSEVNFPGGDGYNLANMFVDGDNPSSQTLIPDSLWTFSVLDPLFLDIKSRTGNISEGYVAFGHSAGAQFLSRFLLFKPESRMQKAICANAGWYTVPDRNVNFPYGLGLSPATEPGIKQAFGKNLLVLLGKLDTNPNSSGLRHNQQADAQGLFRLARGRYFFAESEKIATALNTPLNWKLSEVAGVGHDHALMAKNAVPFVLEAFSKPIPPTETEDEADLTFSAEGVRITDLQPSEKYQITAFNLSGQPVWNQNGVYQNPLTLFWQPAAKGIYILQLIPERSKSKSIKVLINK